MLEAQKEGIAYMLYSWYKRTSMQTKFFLRFMVVLVVVLCCFFVYINWIVILPLKENMENEKRMLALSINNQIDDYLYNQNQLSHRILSNKQVFNILSAGHISTTTEEGLRYSRILKDAMFQAIGPTMNIRDMIIYDLQGTRIAAFLGWYDTPQVINAELKHKLDTRQLFETSYVLHLETDGHVTFNRAIVDQDGVVYGYLTIQLDEKKLQAPTENVADGYIYILDDQQQLIAGTPSDESETAQMIEQLENHNELSGMYLNSEDDYISYNQSEMTGWTTYVVTPRATVLGPVNSVMRLSILIISSLLLMLFVYIYISTKNLLLPIRKLRHQISRIQYNNLNVRVNNHSHNNELISLNEAFQDLLLRLQQSIDREKTAVLEEVKARNSALQAQIAPHFIHNVLYLISIAAQEGNYKAVSEMCKHLSENLRYIVTNPSHHVSLTEELQYTRHYLSLVQAHYEDDLEWEIITDESADNIQIPRLTIQPFVENCIEHAFSQVDPPWRIRIEYKLFNGLWAVEISDNGSGIDPSKLEKILDNIRNANALEIGLHPDHQWGNMGIVNTVHRLQLMYQNRLIFNIFNNPGHKKGVTVLIMASLSDDFY